MKKTTKKLNINKETVASFTTIFKEEMAGVKGGTGLSKLAGNLDASAVSCPCYTDYSCDAMK